ncbi:MAG: DUF2306 domain-containing protein [Pseudonocardiaceae bacterium]
MLTRPWVVPLAALTVAFLVMSLPPYLSLDPSQARLPAPPGYLWYYPMLVTHIFFGSVALLTACLQVWPWLRQHHPAVHRWSGRLYVFAGALPAAVVVLTITPFSVWGANQQTGNTMLAVLWLATTLAGYRATRQRRFADHREWMIRSFALAFICRSARWCRRFGTLVRWTIRYGCGSRFRASTAIASAPRRSWK